MLPPAAVPVSLASAVLVAFVPAGAAVTAAVDGSLFHRSGKKASGVAWQHDGSARGRDGAGRGNCSVIVGIVVQLPFPARQICLPVLFRLHIPKVSASKTEQARELVDLPAAALRGRTLHVAGDALYRGPAWCWLPLKIVTGLPLTMVMFGDEESPLVGFQRAV
jgi:hypothetical protein